MRLDPANSETVEVLREYGVNVDLYEWYTPVDVCDYCYAKLGVADDVDHPPYNDGVDYYCAVCGKLLVVY